MLLALAATPASSPTGSARADDVLALVVVVHPSNRTGALDRDELAAIFTSRRRFWPGGERIVVFNAPPRSPTRVLFDRVVLGLEPEAAGRFWIDEGIRAGARPPRQVPTPQLAVRLVERQATSIAYVPEGIPLGGARVVARIDGGRVLDAQPRRAVAEDRR